MASKLSVLLTFVVLLGCALHTQALTQISNCIELQAMQNNLTEAYELANDIDCSDTVNWNDGEGFEAVGRPSCPFTGELDGRGHVIKDLVINRHVSNMGLFGYTNSTAKITSLKLLDIFIAGNSYVGGLIGKSEGVLISNCVVEGIVRPISASGNYFGGLVADFRGTLTHSSVKGDVGSVSTGWYVGGLVGRNLGNISESYADANTNGAGNDVGGLVGVNAGGSISDCFAAGDTYSKGWHVGGLVGTNRGIIRNCYSSGRPSSPNYLGGLVGTSSDAELVSFSYWDIQASGLSNSGGGVGKTTEEMKQEVTFEYWDFNSIWFVVSGHSYPQFRTTQIHTCEQLQYIPLNVDIYLMQDIACSQTASWNGGAGFIPIGTEAPFTGNFSGQGFIISNLFITRNDELDVGLFSVTKGAVIQNVGLHDVSLIGAQNVGSLIAKASAGTVVSRCHANGYIEGRGTQIGVGGLIGEAESSHIEDSYSITEVVMLGSSISGGLIGRADASTIVNCFSASELKGSGELMGCLVGLAVRGTTITNSYWDESTSDNCDDCNGERKSYDEMRNPDTYLAWDLQNTWTPYKGYDYPRLQWEFTSVISDCEALQAVRYQPSDGYFKLNHDIDCSMTAIWQNGRGFVPIGSSDLPFSGTFDGAGFEIVGLSINQFPMTNVGLFSHLSHAQINNLDIVSSEVTGLSTVGILAGMATDNTHIISCHVKNSFVTAEHTAAGLLGGLHGSDIDISYADVTITVEHTASGLVAEVEDSIVTDSYALGQVTAEYHAAGLMATLLDGSTVERCYAAAVVVAEATVGGLIASNPTAHVVIDSFWDVDISGQQNSQGGAGKTTAEMCEEATFSEANWNFNKVWDINQQRTPCYPFHLPRTQAPIITPTMSASSTPSLTRSASPSEPLSGGGGDGISTRDIEIGFSIAASIVGIIAGTLSVYFYRDKIKECCTGNFTQKLSSCWRGIASWCGNLSKELRGLCGTNENEPLIQ